MCVRVCAAAACSQLPAFFPYQLSHCVLMFYIIVTEKRKQRQKPPKQTAEPCWGGKKASLLGDFIHQAVLNSPQSTLKQPRAGLLILLCCCDAVRGRFDVRAQELNPPSPASSSSLSEVWRSLLRLISAVNCSQES